MVQIITVFLASPGDVATERQHVVEVAAALNRNDERNVQFKVLCWKTDVRPRVHQQGPIDKDLPIEKFDIVVGILWKLLGMPIPEMGGKTGSEHEILNAVTAFRESGKPEVVLCFNDAPFRAKTVEESEQFTQVLKFRFSEEIRGLELAYEGADEFRDKIRDYLEKYLKAHHPVTPGKVSPTGTLDPGGDPTRYLKALREETSHFDVQGLKFGDNRAYRFSIEEFYIPLTTSSSAGAAKHGEMRATTIPLREALLAHRKLLVVGDPVLQRLQYWNFTPVKRRPLNSLANTSRPWRQHRGGGILTV